MKDTTSSARDEAICGIMDIIASSPLKGMDAVDTLGTAFSMLFLAYMHRTGGSEADVDSYADQFSNELKGIYRRASFPKEQGRTTLPDSDKPDHIARP